MTDLVILGSDCQVRSISTMGADKSKLHLLETAPDVPKHIVLVSLGVACRR